MTQLFDTDTIESMRTSMQTWQNDAYDSFAKKMSDKEHLFPCIPATQGFRLNHFRFAFILDPREEKAVEELATLLKEYSETSRDTGNFSSLIVLFETPLDLIQEYSVEDYEALFWSLLNRVSELDEIQWPDHIPTEADNNIWEFCFHGQQYFVYCGTPAHKQRESRRTDVFTLAITPRWVLDEFNRSPELSQKIKDNIRTRLEAYDSAPAHPELKKYGQDDNYEWKQYFLRDDETALSECPFHKLWKNNNEKA
ncbi:YqcI/YcgG family protein [Anaerobacillus alkaliphilus]|uniref:YqcI/YcgG family protein n=1 Tax=Anaerobacillus alkaliphilus TaxID=1548597 RepID=A0A4V1LGW1_9BACI|nr:YqcI/YcgG family protein [Anaerobacillus alkaliphilus]RXJ04115.1 YqcI/YcgG family protein [Anaerobacillus alkaliphilus]